MAQSFVFHIDWTTLAMLIGLLAILIVALFLVRRNRH
jgi:LPXTG-motif cell wall-anchored protein